MKQITHTLSVDCYSSSELSEEDRKLLSAAQEVLTSAYVPYSGFRVGAALLLDNGRLVCGSNQENAAFPAGICAERVALSASSSLYPDIPVIAIALSYKSSRGRDDHPISPCGICRQTLIEYENRQKRPIRLLMGGRSGMVYAVSSVSELLPLSFTAKDLRQL